MLIVMVVRMTMTMMMMMMVVFIEVFGSTAWPEEALDRVCEEWARLSAEHAVRKPRNWMATFMAHGYRVFLYRALVVLYGVLSDCL